MRLQSIRTVFLGAVLLGMACGAGASAQVVATGDRLDVTASSCAAVEGTWRDNGNVSSCCVEAACYVCEVEELECRIEPHAGRLFTPQQLVDLIELAPVVSGPTTHGTS